MAFTHRFYANNRSYFIRKVLPKIASCLKLSSLFSSSFLSLSYTRYHSFYEGIERQILKRRGTDGTSLTH